MKKTNNDHTVTLQIDRYYNYLYFDAKVWVQEGSIEFLVNSTPELNSPFIQMFVHFYFVVVDFQILDDDFFIVSVD